MKYKNLKAMSHNFTHSFVSYMNYVDDGYVVDDLRCLARKVKGEIISINWIPEGFDQWPDFNERIKKSVKFAQLQLPKHLANHGVDRDMISEMRTDIQRLASHQIVVRAYLRDDRGREYIKSVLC